MSEAITQDQKHEVLSLQKQLLDMVEGVTKSGRELDQSYKASVDKFNTRLDALELQLFKSSNAFSDNAIQKHALNKLSEDFNEDRKGAFIDFMRKGDQNLPTNIKTLIESDATTGGYFVVPEIIQDILKSVVLISPLRQFAKIRTTNSNSVKQPKRTSTPSASWGAEVLQQTEMQGLRYGQDEVPVNLMTAYQDISNEDLEDSMFDLSGEVSAEIAEQFAKLEGAGFILGNGKGQPEGILTNPSIGYDTTGNASTLGTGDCFVTCAHNLKSQHIPGARWILNRQTIGAVRLIKDAQNRPLWLPFSEAGLQNNNGPTIVGIPYTEMPDMPAVAAGTTPICLGNFSKGYLIVDRIAITMMRDPYSQSSRGVVRFLARKRVGGQVILTEAMRKIQVGTGAGTNPIL